MKGRPLTSMKHFHANVNLVVPVAEVIACDNWLRVRGFSAGCLANGTKLYTGKVVTHHCCQSLVPAGMLDSLEAEFSKPGRLYSNQAEKVFDLLIGEAGITRQPAGE